MSFKGIGLRLGFVVAGVVALVGLVQAQGDRESGLQITPDELRVLVSKDVGTERWAITRNLDDFTVTGNVFFPEGGDPLFVFCEQTGTQGADLLLSCESADVCLAAPCGADQWSPLADVTLPESFFLPPPAEDEAQMAQMFAEAVAAATDLEVAAGGVRESGLQFTPDGERTIISKDVGAERWAITRNLDDGSVTGNVFFPSGGPPIFIYCEETAQNGADLDFDCFSSDLCPASPCPGDQWELLASVTLPESFFLPEGDVPPSPTPGPVPTATPAPAPTGTPIDGEVCGNGIVEGEEECDGDDLDGEDCDFLVGGLDECTGALRCNSDCTFDASACSCPCESDDDCDFEIDCEQAFPGCDFLFGACNGQTCITTRVGSSQVCNGADPFDPDFLRCE